MTPNTLKQMNIKKTERIIFVIVASLVLAFLVFNKAAQKAISSNNTREYVRPAEENDTHFAAGSQIYQQKCIACHQVNGMGISGTFPPLKGSDFLKKSSKKRIIEQVLNGSDGGIVINNVRYNSSMPPQTDNVTEAIAVVNYILNAWGNDYGKVSSQDTKGIKKTNKNRRRMMMHRGMSGCNMMKNRN